jgi:hypothetical protein
VSDYVHAARDDVLAANLFSIPAFRIAQFWGTYQGFGQRGDAPAALRQRFYYPRGFRGTASTGVPAGARPIDYDAPRRGPEIHAD